MNLELLSYLTDINRLWAIDEATIRGYVAAAQSGDCPLVVEARAPGSAMRADGNVAVLNISGPIDYKASIFTALFGGASIQATQAQFRQAMNDDTIKAIVLNFSSPGGGVYGCTELAAEIFSARGTKPIVAQVDPLCASAAYWLAASADRIHSTPSGDVGSVGVFTLHADLSQKLERDGAKVTVFRSSRFKAENLPIGPLSDEASSAMQSRVNAAGAVFDADNARGRGVTLAEARSRFGEGRLLTAKEAKGAGMIDHISTLEETVLGLLGGGSASRSRARAEETADAIEAPTSTLRAADTDADRRRRFALA